jgi:glycosyltransferase involved in cell wall biosynthesis
VQLYSVKPASLLARIARRIRRELLARDGGYMPYPRLLKEIVESRPALVWFNLTTASDALLLGLAAKACQKKGIPYWLLIHHTHENFFLPDSEETDRCSAVFEGARRVICLSKRNRAALERMIGRHLQNVWVTVNGVTAKFLEQALSAARNCPVNITDAARFLNVARFEPSFKGQHILLEIFSDAQWTTRDWVLVVQGDGSLRPLLHRLIDYYGLPQGRVRIGEYNPNVMQVLIESDLFLMPSLSEGMPFALLEAMACGRPAVGTPVGGIPELVMEGETGWLAESTEIADVADALERAWSARPTWPVLGQKAQALVKASYNHEVTIGKLMAALQQDVQR